MAIIQEHSKTIENLNLKHDASLSSLRISHTEEIEKMVKDQDEKVRLSSCGLYFKLFLSDA